MKILFILIALLFSGNTISQSQEPSPTTLKTNKQKQGRAEEAKNETTEDLRGTHEKPLIVDVIPAPHADEIAKRKSEQEKATLDRLVTAATVALATITFFLTLFTAWLWSATKKLVIGAERTAKHELRAYMGVERIRIHQDSTNTNIPGDWSIKIRNFGKTMAKDTEVWIAGAIGDGTGNSSSGDRRSKTVVMPNEAMGFREAIEKTPKDSEGFRQGSASIYVHGKITYKDVFGENHWTAFRFKGGRADEFFDRETTQREWKVRTDGEGANDAN